jgi:HTH-type transcriptional regulator/antitoxin HigA
MKKPNRCAIHPIRTDADYRPALVLVAPYFDNEPALDSDAGGHFEAMLTLIEAYEAKHYPMSPPNPIL